MSGALTVALVGRPNAGKSSIYNALTGGDAKVGNYPGITVDILEGRLTTPSGHDATIVDLPGFYSVESSIDDATDEGIARRFLAGAKERGGRVVVAQVIDPTRLALGLRLTRELVRQELPVVLILTHGDVLAAEGRAVDVETLSAQTGTPAVLVDARGASARDAVLAAVDDRLRDERTDADVDFDPDAVARAVIRGDAGERARSRMQRSEQVDRVLLHPLLGPLLFIAVMTAVFATVFLVADPTAELFDYLRAQAGAAISRALGGGLLASFVSDGLLGGAGTVLAFMPQIVILTIALELLEASGYLARGAFLVDRLLRLMGLSGRSFVPLLMGHACAIPAIASTRVIRDPRERLTTILVLPLTTCSARLPTYGLVIAAFFSNRSPLFRAGVFVGLYFAGIFTALVASLVLRRSATKGRGLPLVLEIPSYRVPQGRVVLRKASRAARRFLRDVGTTIVCASAALWVLLTVPAPGGAGEGIDASVAASVGRAIEPVTRPAGFDWRINVGLIGSFGARELMVGTLGVIFGVEDADDDPAPLAQKIRDAERDDGSRVYTTRTGLALLAFFVIACQCMSTVAAIRRETKSWRWPAFVVAYTYALGYLAALLTYQLGGVLGVP